MNDIREKFTANANEFDSLVMELFGQCKKEKLALLDQVLKRIPKSWLDPMLTGHDKVVKAGYAFDCKDIEAVLNEVRKRIEKLRQELTEREG